jgi:hypothetical protein
MLAFLLVLFLFLAYSRAFLTLFHFAVNAFIIIFRQIDLSRVEIDAFTCRYLILVGSCIDFGLGQCLFLGVADGRRNGGD